MSRHGHAPGHHRVLKEVENAPSVAVTPLGACPARRGAAQALKRKDRRSRSRGTAATRVAN